LVLAPYQSINESDVMWRRQLTLIERTVNVVRHRAPALKYLSLLANPACPDMLLSLEDDLHDYARYRPVFFVPFVFVALYAVFCLSDFCNDAAAGGGGGDDDDDDDGGGDHSRATGVEKTVDMLYVLIPCKI